MFYQYDKEKSDEIIEMCAVEIDITLSEFVGWALVMKQTANLRRQESMTRTKGWIQRQIFAMFSWYDWLKSEF